MQIIFESTLTCPHCGPTENLKMPTGYCQFFHECSGCYEVLKAKEGHCCVFCSYGDVPCPSVQERNGLSGNQLTKSVWSPTELKDEVGPFVTFARNQNLTRKLRKVIAAGNENGMKKLKFSSVKLIAIVGLSAGKLAKHI